MAPPDHFAPQNSYRTHRHIFMSGGEDSFFEGKAHPGVIVHNKI
jgi:hypothetical protein